VISLENAYLCSFLGGFGGQPPKWGELLTGPPKGTSLRGTTPFDALSVKIGAMVLVVASWKNPRTKKDAK